MVCAWETVVIALVLCVAANDHGHAMLQAWRLVRGLRTFLRPLTFPMSAPVATPNAYCDIGVNLSDEMFRGVYHGSRKHEDDLADVLARAEAAGVKQMIITGGGSDFTCSSDLLHVVVWLYCGSGQPG